MLGIRTITLQLPHSLILNRDPSLDETKHFLKEVNIEYKKNGFKVKTKRIGLDSLSMPDERVDQHKIAGIAEEVNNYCNQAGVRWFNIPFNLVNINNSDLIKIKNSAFEVIKKYSNTFVNFIVADRGIINFEAINKSSKFILDVSKLDNTGFNNFRVGVSANPVRNTPLFPFTCSGNNLGFSIALEIPQEIYSIVKGGNNLEEIRNKIFEKLNPQLILIEKIAKGIEGKFNISYLGIDTSLAPYPEEKGSVAEIVQNLGEDVCGSNGTLFITSYLTDILKNFSKKCDIKTTGFCGVMYSMLEDKFLSKANNKRIISIDSLISYAAVCGCGVDTIPLPGSIFQEEIASIILDICAQSIKLRKSLGVRVLPIPHRQANEFTSFNMDFLYNTRIMNIKNVIFQNSQEDKTFSYINHDE